MDRTRRRNGNGKALTLSGQPSQSELALLMADTQRRYPNQPLTREQADAYLDDWAELVNRYGMRRFIVSLRECWLVCRFFPMAADIIEHVPEQVYEERSALEQIQEHKAEIERRKAAGEPIYTLVDVLKAVKEIGEKKRMPDFKERQSGAQ